MTWVPVVLADGFQEFIPRLRGMLNYNLPYLTSSASQKNSAFPVCSKTSTAFGKPDF